MERETLVYIDLHGATTLVGRLWTRVRSGRESATFAYDGAWLERDDCFALEPALTLDPAPHHTDGSARGRASTAHSARNRLLVDGQR